MSEQQTTEMAATPVEPTAITPLTLLQQAVEKGADLTIVEKLMDLRDRDEATQARKAYTEAMSQFRAECPTIERNKTVDYSTNKGRTSYTHADLAGTISQIKELMSRCGLSHSWRTEQADGQIKVTCMVTHVLGHSESTSMTAPSDTSGSKNPIQAIGSTVTYLERYTLFAMLGLASTDQDDDGAGAEAELIDAETIDALKVRIASVGRDEEKFLKFVGAESFEKMTTAQFKKGDVQLTRAEKKAEGGEK